MFEFSIDKTPLKKRLSADQAGKTAIKIGQMFEDFDNVRQKQKNIYNLLKPEIYLDERTTYKEKDDKWKSDLHLNKIYSLVQTRQAFVWDNIYSNIEQMFDVAGADEVSEEHAAEQKAKLVNDFYKMEVNKKLDKAFEYDDTIGEICLFVGWKQKYRQIRRKMTFAEKLNYGGLTNLFSNNDENTFGIFEELIYDGAYVQAINPINLVFDPKYDPEDEEEWNSCPKIIKDWKDINFITGNKLYKVSKSDLEDLKRLVAGEVTDRQNRDDSLKLSDIVDGNMVEVLEYWGDFHLEDGTVLRNWHAVVLARKYLAIFENNPWVINPIINVATQRDIENKRGIPRVYAAYDLCMDQQKKANLQNDAQALTLNPPCYAPEGLFEDGENKVSPGKIRTYKPGVEDPSAIIRLQFPLINNENIIAFLDQTISAATGIYPNMQGQQEDQKASATEIRVKVAGQTTRLAKDIDQYKQNGIVAMVRKVAELNANMRFGDERIFINEKGQRVTRVINDEIRQGNYEYKYTDSSGIQKKLQTNETLIGILKNVWNDPQLPLDKREIIKVALENAGIENPDKFFVDVQLPQPAQPVPQEMLNIPENPESEPIMTEAMYV